MDSQITQWRYRVCNYNQLKAFNRPNTPITFRVLQDSTQERRLTEDDVQMQPNPVYGIHSTSGQHVYDDIQ